MSERYDVIVLGVGTAGSRAAATAARAGARVLAIEAGAELGGLCILRGCMPTKTLLETAHRLHEIRDAARFGIAAPPPRLDFGAMMRRTRRLVRRFQRAKVASIEGAGYELRRARARLLDPHTVEVEGERCAAKAIVLATGSRPRPLPFPVEEGTPVLTSDDLFALRAAPRRALVVGAGAVGLEFAQWLARCGSQVVLANRSPLLRRWDPELGQELARALGEELTVAAPLAFEEISSEALRARDGLGREVRYPVGDFVLNAVGRVPDLGGLGLEALGLDPTAPSFDEHLRLGGLSHVFVAGDATGTRALLHEANREGAVAGANAALVARGEAPREVLDPTVPPLMVIFTDPPFACVGRTPQACEAEGIPYAVATKRFPQQGRGIVVGARHGLVRLLAEPGGGKLLGCQILGPRADDLIHVPAAVLTLGGTAGDLYRTPWYHPTLAEAFIEVARSLSGG
ncbi:MAG: FAD-dependent oxidoreductase [Planctomycetota bacterium]|nr:MAG: FAD-dependent oxidoreductase [Planctomycetota bacterium]